ncbi:MAG: hypothetical protein Ct9H90mP2_13670 [Dehalococcoidia bacterium]|nr:MAG: hypothetical protein Ct9H90mP2_13670 [Dehalococcoidia bacterium]
MDPFRKKIIEDYRIFMEKRRNVYESGKSKIGVNKIVTFILRKGLNDKKRYIYILFGFFSLVFHL